MFDSLFARVKIPMFAKLLDVAATRQRLIARNLANVETPGYQAGDVDFARVLQDLDGKVSIKVRRSNERHLPNSQQEPSIPFKINTSREQFDGRNNVDVDKEMVKSAENQLYYTANSKIIAGKFKALHTAIKGRS